MAAKSFLPGKKKFLLALVATVIGAAITVYLVHKGESAMEAATVAGVVVGSLWLFIGVEGGRDIVRTHRKPE
jgi:uncharacterized membrane protein